MNNDSGIAAPILCDIIINEMDLPPANVWIADENKVIPNDTQLYVSVGLSDSHPLGVCTTMQQVSSNDDPPVITQVEINTVNAREMIQVDIFSRSTLAKIRHWEIIAALQSIYGQQQQELYNFKICRNPVAFANTSSAEGGSFINRYTITFACLVWYSKQKTLTADGDDYYDTFPFRLDFENTIGNMGPYTYDDGTPPEGYTYDDGTPTEGATFDEVPPPVYFEITSEGIQPL